jgi:hypothetical protein
MSLFTKIGAEATASASNDGGSNVSPITSFKTGTTFKVGIKSVDDVAEYYGYGSFGRGVKTFVPKDAPTRNARGYIDANPSVWDRAADALYADVKELKEAGAAEADIKAVSDEASIFRGKKRYLRAFYDLTTGKDIVVDLSPNQEALIAGAIRENAEDLDSIAFKLAKKGKGKDTTVSLTAIIKMERDLTEDERANFTKLGDAPFDMETLESCLYVADEAEQVKNLVIAGFDIGRLGLTYGGSADNNAPPIDADIPPEDPAANF